MSFDFDWGSNAPYIGAAFALTGAILVWMIADSLLRAKVWRRKSEALAKDSPG